MYSTIKCTRNVGKPTYVQYFGAALLFIPVFLNFFPCEMSICCSIPVRHVYRFSVDWGVAKTTEMLLPHSSGSRRPEGKVSAELVSVWAFLRGRSLSPPVAPTLLPPCASLS